MYLFWWEAKGSATWRAISRLQHPASPTSDDIKTNISSIVVVITRSRSRRRGKRVFLACIGRTPYLSLSLMHIAAIMHHPCTNAPKSFRFCGRAMNIERRVAAWFAGTRSDVVAAGTAGTSITRCNCALTFSLPPRVDFI